MANSVSVAIDGVIVLGVSTLLSVWASGSWGLLSSLGDFSVEFVAWQKVFTDLLSSSLQGVGHAIENDFT
jgi:hypothetical protein